LGAKGCHARKKEQKKWQAEAEKDIYVHTISPEQYIEFHKKGESCSLEVLYTAAIYSTSIDRQRKMDFVTFCKSLMD
jgi:hypothetical protein